MYTHSRVPNYFLSLLSDNRAHMTLKYLHFVDYWEIACSDLLLLMLGVPGTDIPAQTY